MSNQIRVAIYGASGRMGQRLISLGHADSELQIVAAIVGPSSRSLGKDAGEHAGIGKIGVPFTTELPAHVDAVIDFSTPEAAITLANQCAERRIPLVEATTGLTPHQKAEIVTAAQETAIVQSPSMSLAVNVAMKLVGQASQALKNVASGVDVEIVERHHRFKEDAPSGTALKFGQIVADEMGQTVQQHGRQGQTGKRPRNEIGFHALRTGDNVGEHQIVFGLMGETLEVSVRGHTRDSYAYGALAAAKFVAGKAAGIYTMADVLGL